MKKLIFLVLILFFPIFSYSQSRVVFTIDNPLTSIQKPKYEFKDYQIPLKSVGIFRGIYSGLYIIFSENESETEYYFFEIMLPSNNLFYIDKIEDGTYILSNGIIPIEFTDKDFSEGVYVERIDKYIWTNIILKKYSKDVYNTLVCKELIEFKNFSINFIDFKCYDSKIILKAELKGSVNFSSGEYDAPYNVTATIEINSEVLGTIFVD